MVAAEIFLQNEIRPLIEAAADQGKNSIVIYEYEEEGLSYRNFPYHRKYLEEVIVKSGLHLKLVARNYIEISWKKI